MKVWRCAAGVASFPQERWSSSVLLLLKFLAFVPKGSLVKPLAVCVSSPLHCQHLA